MFCEDHEKEKWLKNGCILQCDTTLKGRVSAALVVKVFNLFHHAFSPFSAMKNGWRWCR